MEKYAAFPQTSTVGGGEIRITSGKRWFIPSFMGFELTILLVMQDFATIHSMSMFQKRIRDYDDNAQLQPSRIYDILGYVVFDVFDIV